MVFPRDPSRLAAALPRKTSLWLKFDKYYTAQLRLYNLTFGSWEGKSYDKTLVIGVGEEGKITSCGKKTKRNFCNIVTQWRRRYVESDL